MRNGITVRFREKAARFFFFKITAAAVSSGIAPPFPVQWKVMRIAVLSDIHANLLAFEAVVKDLKRTPPDFLVFLGDLVVTGPRPKECFELLKSLHPAVWILGNTDDWLTEDTVDNTDVLPPTEHERLLQTMGEFARTRLDETDQAFLLSRPISRFLSFPAIESADTTFEIDRTALFADTGMTCCHASPASYTQSIHPGISAEVLHGAIRGARGRLIVCGHTHYRVCFSHNGVTVFNFGSVSMPFNSPILYPSRSDIRDGSRAIAQYGIVEIGQDGLLTHESRDVQFDLSELVRDMERQNYPGLDIVLEKYVASRFQ